MRITGRLIDGGGQPVGDALLEVWQADAVRELPIRRDGRWSDGSIGRLRSRRHGGRRLVRAVDGQARTCPGAGRQHPGAAHPRLGLRPRAARPSGHPHLLPRRGRGQRRRSGPRPRAGRGRTVDARGARPTATACASTSTSRASGRRCSLPFDGALLGPSTASDRAWADVDDTAWLQAMLDVEAALARPRPTPGSSPEPSPTPSPRAAGPTASICVDLGRRAATAGNPVIPLVADLRAAVPAEARAAVHVGATSQDVIDTSLMLLAKRSLTRLNGELERAASAAATLAERHRGDVAVGRTLGAARRADHVRAHGGDLAGGPGRRPGAGRPRRRRAAGRPARRGGGHAGAARCAPVRRWSSSWPPVWGWPLPPLPWHTTRVRIGRAGVHAGDRRRQRGQGRHRRHRAGSHRGRRGPGRLQRRLVGHAPQAQPGPGHARRLGRPPGERPGLDRAGRPAPGAPAGRRPLARGVGAAADARWP